MKHITAKSNLVAALLAAISLPLAASANERPIEVPWQQVCNTSYGQQLILTTETGETIQGYCVSIDVNKIGVRTPDQRVVQIARSTLSKLEMKRPRTHQLASLGKGVRHELHEGVKILFSPMAPGGLILIPGTLAWGAVAAPFCILGDLFAPPEQIHEIKVQP
jgi:hypothetical protein